jgi:hypothetical protein
MVSSGVGSDQGKYLRGEMSPIDIIERCLIRTRPGRVRVHRVDERVIWMGWDNSLRDGRGGRFPARGSVKPPELKQLGAIVTGYILL